MHVLSSDQSNFLSPHEWDELIRQLPSGHLLQSWAWGDLKAHFGWHPLRVVVVDDDRALAAAQILFKRLPTGLLTTAYIPKGPIVSRLAPDDSSALALLTAIHDSCRRKRAISLKLEPDWEDSTETREWLQQHGFLPSQQTVQPPRTIVVDLEPDEEAILAQMRSKTRYNIRLAQRRGVSVRQGTEEDLATFYQLLQITGQRAGFAVHTRTYYTRVWELFAPLQSVASFLAQWDGRTVAAIMVFIWGKRAWYMYGASSNEGRRHMPNHLLQWEAMRWAKARGCETYDLWGIPDVDKGALRPDMAKEEKEGLLSTGLGGLYRFKRGFGGREVRCVGAYDHIYNQPLYRLLTSVWDWRKR